MLIFETVNKNQHENSFTTKELKMESIKINGMSCQHCVASVKKALEAVPGLSEIAVDLSGGKATFKNNGANRAEIASAITQIGFEPQDE